jgi:hypothetical protein
MAAAISTSLPIAKEPLLMDRLWSGNVTVPNFSALGILIDMKTKYCP